METAQKQQRRLIRAVYPNRGDKRGYYIVLTRQVAKRFATPYWLKNWVGKLTPQPLGGC